MIFFCKLLLLAHVKYCDVIYGSRLNSIDVNRIEKLQSGCLKLRKYLWYMHNQKISYVLQHLKWLNMYNR